MTENECPARFVIKRGAESDGARLTIADSEQPEGPARIRHSSHSWEATATHLAFALDRVEKLKNEVVYLRAKNRRLQACLVDIGDLALDYNGHASSVCLKDLIDEIALIARSQKPRCSPRLEEADYLTGRTERMEAP